MTHAIKEGKDWYLATKGIQSKRHPRKNKPGRTIFLIKSHTDSDNIRYEYGVINAIKASFPKKLIGKRARFRVEFV